MRTLNMHTAEECFIDLRKTLSNPSHFLTICFVCKNILTIYVANFSCKIKNHLFGTRWMLCSLPAFFLYVLFELFLTFRTNPLLR